MKGASILKHPLKDEIIRRLLDGQSVYTVARWLAEKNTGDKKYQISWMTLQEFRKNYLNLEGKVLDELKHERKRELAERREKKRKEILAETLSNTQVEGEVAQQVAQKVLDMNTTISFIYNKIMSQIKLLENEEFNYKNSKVISDYISQLRGLMTDYAKILQKYDESEQVKNTVSENEIIKYVALIKEAVREILSEIAPDKLELFYDKLREKIDIYRKVGERKNQALTLLESKPRNFSKEFRKIEQFSINGEQKCED